MNVRVRNDLEILCRRMYGGVCLMFLLSEALEKDDYSAGSYADASFAVHDYLNGLVGELNMLLSLGKSV